MAQVCPYCGLLIDEPTRDHIFSQFLGGRRTIPACARCNNGFGEAFEGRYSQALLQIKAWLTWSGVPQRWERDFRWKNALTYEGEPSDLIVRDGKVLIVPAAPQISRDEHGRPIQLRARSVSEANRISESLIRKGKVTGDS